MEETLYQYLRVSPQGGHMKGNRNRREKLCPDQDAGETGSRRTGARIDPIVAVVAGGIVIVGVIIFAVLSLGSQMGAVVPVRTCGERTLSYVNGNLVEAGTAATLVSANETHGMYQVTVDYQGEVIPLFVTRDCDLLFMAGRDMNIAIGTPAPTPTPTPVKTDRPGVELYVMSFCPYGIQAETAMKPVSDLLGSRADIRVLYLTRVGGTTVASVESLHGPVEVQEDFRQACIEKHYPDRFWDYLSGFNAACSSLSGNATATAGCSARVSSSLGMDNTGIDGCVTGPEGLDLISSDEASAVKAGAASSPTLLINGVEYGGARTPEAYKQAICGSFTTTPAECQTVLSTQQAAAGGSC